MFQVSLLSAPDLNSMSAQRSRRRCGDLQSEPSSGCEHTPRTMYALSKFVELPTPPLSRHQLKKLEEHRYSSCGKSLLEPLMQGFWEWLVGKVPAWIAPNLITIIGLIINIFTTVVLVYHCPTATEQVTGNFCVTCLVYGVNWLSSCGWEHCSGHSSSSHIKVGLMLNDGHS